MLPRLESWGPAPAPSRSEPGPFRFDPKGGEMRSRIWKVAVFATIAVLVLGACTREEEPETQPTETSVEESPAEEETTAPTTGETLAAVQAAGTLRCGVNNTVPGFG